MARQSTAESAVDGDWEGMCRVCWKRRNLGLDYRPKGNAVVYCGLANPDGSLCTGRLLLAMTPAAKRRSDLARRQKKAKEFKR